jgi:hypothetical protein
MLRPALALLGLVLGSVVLAAPAEAATYSVTLTASHTNRDVGQTLTLTGKVAGSKAAGKKLTVQRRVADGPWSTIGTVRATSKKTFTVKHKVSRTGAQSFRVVAPKSGSTKTGTSPARSITGWTWLYLTDQPHFTTGGSFVGTKAVVGDTTYARSVELTSGSGTRAISWSLDGRCNASDVDVALDNSQLWSVQTVDAETDDGGASQQAMAGERRALDVVTSASDYVTYSVTANTSNVKLVSPRLHCSVSRLPDITF